jgi:hypothetical protein
MQAEIELALQPSARVTVVQMGLTTNMAGHRLNPKALLVKEMTRGPLFL